MDEREDGPMGATEDDAATSWNFLLWSLSQIAAREMYQNDIFL
jgi:hypothetical protein